MQNTDIIWISGINEKIKKSKTQAKLYEISIIVTQDE